jgi:hypothetical protein
MMGPGMMGPGMMGPGMMGDREYFELMGPPEMLGPDISHEGQG